MGKRLQFYKFIKLKRDAEGGCITTEYPHFTDFADETNLFCGDKKKVDNILNQEILILGFKIKTSTKRENSLYATVQFKMNEIEYIFFTGSKVIIDQLNKYKETIPFYTIIKKVDKYYTFS